MSSFFTVKKVGASLAIVGSSAGIIKAIADASLAETIPPVANTVNTIAPPRTKPTK